MNVSGFAKNPLKLDSWVSSCGVQSRSEPARVQRGADRCHFGSEIDGHLAIIFGLATKDASVVVIFFLFLCHSCIQWVVFYRSKAAEEVLLSPTDLSAITAYAACAVHVRCGNHLACSCFVDCNGYALPLRPLIRSFLSSGGSPRNISLFVGCVVHTIRQEKSTASLPLKPEDGHGQPSAHPRG